MVLRACFNFFWVVEVVTAIARDAQRLLTALHLGITAGAWGTIWDAEDQTQISPVIQRIKPGPLNTR